jgi:hypothetical protein
VNIDALPYTAYLLLAELTVGSLAALLFADARGFVERGFVKYCAAQTTVVAAIALPLAWWAASGDIASGYPVRERGFDLAWWLLGGCSAFAAVYAALTFATRRRAEIVAGAVGVALGLGALASIAYALGGPVWNYGAILTSIVFGALATGGVTLAMVLGHWYLVTPRLPNRPLNELTLFALAAVAGQAILMAVNLAAGQAAALDVTTVFGEGLAANPALWLRAGVGLALAGACVAMAYLSSRESSMMSATGLLYIAMGAVFAGELLARGVLFATAVPV